MDQATLRQREARCTQEAMPQCQAACPLRMDVRAFMTYLENGDMREARRLLERHLPLPEIMARICDHPCEDSCLRRERGGSLAVAALEAACMTYTSRQSGRFPRSPKAGKAAVLGSGLAGLTAAFDLCQKAWPVTVFHEDDVLATLLKRFPRLPQAMAQREVDALAAAGCVFERRRLDSALLNEARGAFDVVFVDADAAEPLVAGLEGTPDPLTGQVSEKLCAGGMLEQSPGGARYASASRQAGEGRRAAATLERMLTGVSLTAEREGELARKSPLQTQLDHVSPQEHILPQGESYTEEEARREAARCIRCQCLACVRECAYLQKYGGYPRVYARQIYNNASIVKGEHLANSLINGCALCGQCAEICPERFSMAELCLEARQDMVRRNYMPQSAHEFALEDMENADSAACAAFMDALEHMPNAYAFFPGCQLTASRGEQVLAAYDYIRGALPGGVGLFLSCCGVPAHWAGEEALFQNALARLRAVWEAHGKPTLVVACASCRKTFREHAPDMQTISLWEVLDNSLDSLPDADGGEYCMHDPCAARHDAGWQKAVRGLAAKCGVRIEEPRRTGKETACCGYGGLAWCAQPELADAMSAHRAAELRKPALASCIMCRDRLARHGAHCLHLLDILPFSKTVPGAEAALQPVPGLSARRANRAALRRKAAMRYLGEAAPKPAESRVFIDESLLAQLERKHILREDAEQAVAAVEAAKARFLERRTGHYVGSWRPRRATFWVRYSVEGDGGYALHDAWCHRMIVPNTGGAKE